MQILYIGGNNGEAAAVGLKHLYEASGCFSSCHLLVLFDVSEAQNCEMRMTLLHILLIN